MQKWSLDIVIAVTPAVPTAPIEPYVSPAERWTSQQKGRFIQELQHLVDSLPATSNKHDRAIVAIHFCIKARVDMASLLRGYLRLVGFNTGHISSLPQHETGDRPEGNHWTRNKAGRYTNTPFRRCRATDPFALEPFTPSVVQRNGR